MILLWNSFDDFDSVQIRSQLQNLPTKPLDPKVRIK
jgi:hypothetical protein